MVRRQPPGWWACKTWPLRLGWHLLEDVINGFDPRAVNTCLANFVLAQQVWAAVYAHRGSCEMESTSYWVDGRCNQIAMVDIVRTVDVIGGDRPYFYDLEDLLTSPLLDFSLPCFRHTAGRFVLRIRHSLLVCFAVLLGVP